MNQYESLLTNMNPYEPLWILRNPYESLWILMHPYETERMPMTLYMNPHESVYDLLRIRMIPYESLWIRMHPYEFSWIYLHPYESPVSCPVSWFLRHVSCALCPVSCWMPAGFQLDACECTWGSNGSFGGLLESSGGPWRSPVHPNPKMIAFPSWWACESGVPTFLERELDTYAL